MLLDPKNITIGASTELQSWSYQGVIGQWYSQDFEPSNLEASDSFGSSLALSDNGRLLAIGAPNDDDASNGSTNTGAVYLYEFTDDDYGGASLAGIIGDGYTGNGNVNVTLGDSDAFGSSLALSGNGKIWLLAQQMMMAIQIAYLILALTIYLYSDSSFSGGAHSGTIGQGFHIGYFPW